MSREQAEGRQVAYYIFRSKMTVNGVVLYAKDYGLKAFRIPIYRWLKAPREILLPWRVIRFVKNIESMAKTKSSIRGKQSKKIVVVKPYTKKDGTKVPEHRRSTPN